mgnify:FL=1
MGNKKTTSLKKLQEELLNLVKNKYYCEDEEIANCIDRINEKYEENAAKAFERKLMRIEKGEQAKPIATDLSIETLQLCDKLIVKEKVSNQIMGYEAPFDLINAEQEIKAGIAKWIK